MKFSTLWLGLLVIFLLLLNVRPAWAIAPTSERIFLTPELLQERLNSPIISDGLPIINLQNLIINLTKENAPFREQFYQQIQSTLNRSPSPLGLDFSDTLIQGDFTASRLGLSTSLSSLALPSLLSTSEQEQLQQDQSFLSEPGEQVTTVSIFRGIFKLNRTRFTGKVDFSKLFFLQRLEALDTFFSQESNWSETRFGRTTDFSHALFSRMANFSKSIFFGKARFSKAQFREIITFAGSIFRDQANFNQGEFWQFTDFTHSQWLKDAYFRETTWHERVLFSQSRFFQSLFFTYSTLEKPVAFRSVLFNASVDFQDVKLLTQVDFSNSIFTPGATLNVGGLAFESDQAKILGESGVIGNVISLAKLEGNETVLHNLVRNFRNLEQIPDANQIEYQRERLRQQQLQDKILGTSLSQIWRWHYLQIALQWGILSILLLLSDYGTNSSLVFGVGLVVIAYFGLLFWLIDRWRRRIPQPILPSRYETLWMIGSFAVLTFLGIFIIIQVVFHSILTLICLGLICWPFPLYLILRLYQEGRYHDLMETSYLVQEGSLRQLRLLIVRLPIIPRFPEFHNRYLPLLLDRRWNWLNYYDFSLNNFFKIGFNDIRLRDEHLPGLIATLVWYQWSLGLLYATLLLWTLSRTIPGLNLLIYLK